MLEVQIKPTGLKEAEKALANIKGGYPKAAGEAINRGLLAGQTAIAKEIAGRYAITSGEVKQHINMKKASWTKLEGNLVVSGSMLNVSAFKITSSTIKGSRGPRRQQLSVTIIRGQKSALPGAFLTPKGQVMQRRQPSRFPIFPVSTISLAHMAGQTAVSKLVQDRMHEVTNSRLAHNIEQALSGGQFTKE